MSRLADYFWKCWYLIGETANGMDMRDWAWAAAVVLVVGLLCMRGLAAKTNY